MNLTSRARRDGLKLDVLGRVASATLLSLAMQPAMAQQSSPEGATPVPKVSVQDNAAAAPTDGTVASGYKPESVQTTGPWGPRSTQDTPYSISVIPADLIQNVQAASTDDLFNMNPFTQVNIPQSRIQSVALNVRGLGQSSAIDGISTSSYVSSLEDKERVEILSGLSGFLYGPTLGGVGGVVNFVMKRPTPTPLYDVTVGTYGGGNYYAHADLGGPIVSDGTVGYRLNAVLQDGQTAIDDQNQNRKLISGAVDWHVTDRLLVQLNGSYEYSKLADPTAYWFVPAGTPHPAAPDTNETWGQSWSFDRQDINIVGARLKWDLSEVFSFRGGYFRQRTDRLFDFINNFFADDFNYDSQWQTGAQTFTDWGHYEYIDANFTVAGIQNRLTFGFLGKEEELDKNNGSRAYLTPDFSLAGPVSTPEPLITPIGPVARSSTVASHNWSVGDELTLTPQWQILVGVTHGDIIAKNYNMTSEALTSDYDKGATTPSASLVFKPVPWVSTYFTYMESLEQGVIVPTGLDYTNEGQILPPMVSREKEVGAKANMGAVLLTAALFRVDKANQFAIDNADGSSTYVQDGQEVHKGIELSLSGKVTDALTLVGGATLMHSEVVSEADDPAEDGQRPVDVSDQLVRFYAEYALAQIPGLVLAAGVDYTGPFYGDDVNTDRIPGVTTGNLGARYATRMGNTPVTVRLNANNITGRSYWVSSHYLGNPRSVSASLEASF